MIEKLIHTTAGTLKLDDPFLPGVRVEWIPRASGRSEGYTGRVTTDEEAKKYQMCGSPKRSEVWVKYDLSSPFGEAVLKTTKKNLILL